MTTQIVFATHNSNKTAEIQKLIGVGFSIKTLDEIGLSQEIPETSNTLEGNALQKSSFVYDKFKCNVFSDDTGLEVFSLKGEPGVYSARYAGEQKNNEQNISLLLKNLKGFTDRSAQFRTVISLFYENNNYMFEGIVKGKIIEKKRGSFGFGYDSIFVPEGYDKTFAEISLEEKNKISHRAIAFRKMFDKLKSIY